MKCLPARFSVTSQPARFSSEVETGLDADDPARSR